MIPLLWVGKCSLRFLDTCMSVGSVACETRMGELLLGCHPDIYPGDGDIAIAIRGSGVLRGSGAVTIGDWQAGVGL